MDLERILWAAKPTPEARAERLKTGNGYLQWLKIPCFDPEDAVECYRLFIDQDMDGLLERARNLRLHMTRQKPLEWIEKHYRELGIDPLDIDATRRVECHFLNAASMMPTIIAAAMGRFDLNKDSLRSVGTTESVRWFHGFNAWKHRNQTFKITEGLASKLLLTEIRGLEWDDFRMPFPSFVIQVPSDLIMLRDPDTGEHPLDTIMVTEAKDGDERVLSFVFLGQENANSKGVGDDAVFYLNMHSREKLIEASMLRTTASKGDLRGQANPVVVAGEDGRSGMAQAVRFALNIITYITSRPEDVTRQRPAGYDALAAKAKRLGGHKAERIRQKMKAMRGPSDPFVVGSHVTIDKNLSRVAREEGRGSRAAAACASYVRGFFRMQPYGPQHSLRRLQWIEPFWRNLGAEEGSKDYTVK